MEPCNYAELDPGIRDVVMLLRQARFDTTDSGDGVSKPAEAIELPFPHVIAVVDLTQFEIALFSESERMQQTLDREQPGRWTVEATYFPVSKRAVLLASAELNTK